MKRGAPISGEELHIFANALRECLGLDPLYGDGENPGAVEYRGVRLKKVAAADAARATDLEQPIAAE